MTYHNSGRLNLMAQTAAKASTDRGNVFSVLENASIA